MPAIGQVAIGKKPSLTIFGSDYNTPDGTGVRDYIHIMDLVSGHLASLSKLAKTHLNYKTYNLGTGQGVSVLQLVKSFEAVTKTQVAYTMAPRREGDSAAMFADATLAKEDMGWTSKYTLENMCEHFWRWKTMNPNGYENDEPYISSILDDRPSTTAKDSLAAKMIVAIVVNVVNGLNGIRHLLSNFVLQIDIFM